MTSNLIRRSLIILFLFNLVLIFQNWTASRTLNGLQELLREAISEKSPAHAEINRKLDALVGKERRP